MRPAPNATLRGNPAYPQSVFAPGVTVGPNNRDVVNDYTTGTFQQITGRPPRPVAEFLHQYRAEFT